MVAYAVVIVIDIMYENHASNSVLTIDGIASIRNESTYINLNLFERMK